MMVPEMVLETVEIVKAAIEREVLVNLIISKDRNGAGGKNNCYLANTSKT
jgi:hypothetical protein